ncbi:MAG: DUF5659 domain-containing protein [Candidatus Nomurabacteria bacterium]|nr:DUF5659 domain-containing protein [Candidatus Nomurabacteria bacterium]
MNENMKIIKESNFFECSDISLASTLFYFGYKIEAINKNNSSRVVFVFERDNKLDELIQGFWAHSLGVDPLGYFNCLKEIKTRLYQ